MSARRAQIPPATRVPIIAQQRKYKLTAASTPPAPTPPMTQAVIVQ